jgi:hypothetical protein
VPKVKEFYHLILKKKERSDTLTRPSKFSQNVELTAGRTKLWKKGLRLLKADLFALYNGL